MSTLSPDKIFTDEEIHAAKAQAQEAISSSGGLEPDQAGRMQEVIALYTGTLIRRPDKSARGIVKFLSNKLPNALAAKDESAAGDRITIINEFAAALGLSDELARANRESTALSRQGGGDGRRA